MIDIIDGLPSDVVGLRASGQVTAEDYEDTVIPIIEKTISENGKINLLYHIGPDCTGFTPLAVWNDTKLGLAHLMAWKRIAIVTDVSWIKKAIGYFSFAIPGEVMLYTNAEFEKAKEWVITQ